MTNQQITDLGAAGVPQDAIKRLSELQPGKAGSIFTSDLSVNEFLLVREVGFKPLGLVLGSSIYHVGLQVGRWGKNQEGNVLSQAVYHARAWVCSPRASTTSACRWAAGARTRSSTSSPRRCTTRGSWRCRGWRPRRTRSAPTASWACASTWR